MTKKSTLLDQMKRVYQKKMMSINALHNRERLLLLFSLVIIIYILWAKFLYQPVKLNVQKTKAEINYATNKIEETNQQIQAMADTIATVSKTGHEDVSTRAELMKTAKILDMQLGILTSDLISPEQMASALHTMLSRQKGLELLSLDTIPATEVEKRNTENHQDQNNFDQSQEKTTEEDNMVVPGLYKHEIKIVLLGDYFSVLNYLVSLEGLGWRLFWDKLDYEVMDYPTAQITITLHTLSSEKGFIGGGK